MDPPLVNEASFTAAANPSSYNLAGLLSFPGSSGGAGLGLRTGSLGGGGGDGSLGESTVTEQSSSRGGNGGKKRRRDTGNSVDDSSSKLVSTSAANQDLNEFDLKRMKASGSRDKNSGSKVEAEANSEPSVKPVEEKNKPEPPNDYIHVRARRGQATDSHSLAERARRVKISERMKILQNLVPGCNKVRDGHPSQSFWYCWTLLVSTSIVCWMWLLSSCCLGVIGKAPILDEIINYIQSLQHQVEFLSMKLEAVNSRLLAPMIEGFPTANVAAPTFDANGKIYESQMPREYGQGSQAEWLPMQVGSVFERSTRTLN